MIKKLMLVFLAAVMVFAVFACTKSEGNKPADTTTPEATTPEATTPPVETTTPPVTTEPDPSATLDLELQTFNGKDFRVSCSSRTEYEVFAEESSANIRDRAVWERNAIVQDTYDITIVPLSVLTVDVHDHVNEMQDLIYSGDDIFDLGLSNAHASSPLIMNGLVYNWNNKENFKYNDFSKDYWMNNINDLFVIADALYTPVGDMCLSVLTYTYAIMYNRSKGDSLFVDEGFTTITEDVLDKIDNMEWTIDYFIELTSNIYQDIDDINGPSDNDFYGFTADSLTSLDIWQFAFDIPMIGRDDVEYIVPVVNNEKTYRMVDKLRTLYMHSSGSRIDDPLNRFVKGNAVFVAAPLVNCYDLFANMSDTYTILPYPLWDENQEKYQCSAMDNYNLISVPITCTELDMVSYIVEVLNYISREDVFPVYYEDALQKRAQDPDSIRMLDLIMDGRTFDLGTLLYKQTTCLPLLVRWAVGSDMDFAEVYDQNERMINSGIKYFVRKCKENAQI